MHLNLPKRGLKKKRFSANRLSVSPFSLNTVSTNCMEIAVIY